MGSAGSPFFSGTRKWVHFSRKMCRKFDFSPPAPFLIDIRANQLPKHDSSDFKACCFKQDFGSPETPSTRISPAVVFGSAVGGHFSPDRLTWVVGRSRMVFLRPVYGFPTYYQGSFPAPRNVRSWDLLAPFSRHFGCFINLMLHDVGWRNCIPAPQPPTCYTE